jgi:SAM-dependent methyltransferase
MYIVDRSLRFVRGALLSYGPSSIKKFFWDKEFAGGKWNFIDNTLGDCVYAHLEKFANNGSILDLGCGPGNTANEVADSAYRKYVGVDISKEALAKAKQRSVENGRGIKNQFECSDFLSYVPTQKFDVILFRESMYHVPIGKIQAMLERLSQSLKPGGVFIVRMYTVDDGQVKQRPIAMFELLEKEFSVVEKSHYAKSGATVMVLQPKGAAAPRAATGNNSPVGAKR